MSLLVVIGAAVVVLLGSAHLAFTLQSTPAGGPLTPTDDRVRAAMELTGGLGMAPALRTTLWKAWFGFNLSHSIGVVAIGLVVGVPALVDFDDAIGRWWWVATAFVAPAVYLVISIRYWFRNPTAGITLAAVLIWSGVIAGLVSS